MSKWGEPQEGCLKQIGNLYTIYKTYLPETMWQKKFKSILCNIFIDCIVKFSFVLWLSTVCSSIGLFLVLLSIPVFSYSNLLDPTARFSSLHCVCNSLHSSAADWTVTGSKAQSAENILVKFSKEEYCKIAHTTEQ